MSVSSFRRLNPGEIYQLHPKDGNPHLVLIVSSAKFYQCFKRGLAVPVSDVRKLSSDIKLPFGEKTYYLHLHRMSPLCPVHGFRNLKMSHAGGLVDQELDILPDIRTALQRMIAIE